MRNDTAVAFLDILSKLVEMQLEMAQKIYAAEYAMISSAREDVLKLLAEYRQNHMGVVRGEMGSDRHIDQCLKVRQAIADLRTELSQNPDGE